MSPLQELHRENRELRRLLKQYEAALDRQKVTIKKLQLGFVGKKPERTPSDARQLSLDVINLSLRSGAAADDADESVEVTSTADAAEKIDSGEPEKVDVGGHTRARPTGRKPLSDDLEVVRIEVLPTNVEEKGTSSFKRIGEVVSEVVERRPASVVRLQIVRPKFVPIDAADDECDGDAGTPVSIADVPELPIQKGLAGPGMLADSVVRRWEDHIPANRLERVYARDRLDIARSTICGWHIALSKLCKPLLAAMFADALVQPYLCTDATGVLVQSKDACRRGHFWVLVAPLRHVLFRFSERHNSAAVDELLEGYEGYLVADAHAVYDHLYAKGGVEEVSCWAHCRRYFFYAVESAPEQTRKPLAILAKLFAVEREIADRPRKQREHRRRHVSAPLVDHFFQWCLEERDALIDESPLSKAVNYALNQQSGLRTFLKDGRLPLSNNISERALRHQAVGRKNWLFVGSPDGAVANTTFVSLIASCRLQGIDSWSYLRDLFCLLPDWPARRVLELAPCNWQETFQNPETQRLLDANIFRRQTLPSHRGED